MTNDVCDLDHPRENCGIVGMYNVADCAPLISQGLFSLQHRGQEGAGIAVSNGTLVSSHKGTGLVSQVFGKQKWEQLPGHLGIGHVRYSTTGSTRVTNVQPLVVEISDGLWAIAHNGNLVNAGALRRQYQGAGAIFQTSADSEVLLHLLADPAFRTRPRRVARALDKLKGAFSFLLMTKDCLMGARDPRGFRPLSIGRIGDGYVLASETCALNQLGATYERDVQPGELVVIDNSGLHSSFFAEEPDMALAHCIFEHVYFARPDSRVFDESVNEVRVKLGIRLAQEHPVDADVVIPIPDSGSAAALGYSQQSGLPFNYGFIRNHYVGRTFIMPQQDDRVTSNDMKHAVVPGVVRGQRVIVVDDSIVRGNTCRRRIAALREHGAKEVHMRISCPPTRHPCFFGIDFPSSSELIAANNDVAEICEFLGCDTLGYLSLEGLLSTVKAPGDYCNACFSGDYPMDVDADHRKQALQGEPLLHFEVEA